MPNLNQITRLLEAAEAMTSLLQNHQAELAAGQEPLVFTAVDTYVELQEAATEMRKTIELGFQPTDPLRGLLNMHGLMLETNPHAYFELAYTRYSGWLVCVCDKQGTGIPGTREWNSSRTVLASSRGDTLDEACDDAIDQLTELTSTDGGRIQPNEIPY